MPSVRSCFVTVLAGGTARFDLRVRAFWLLLGSLWILGGCEGALTAKDLDWSVSFACEADRTRADQVALRVLRGGCSGTSIYSAAVMRGESAKALKDLAPGAYGFEAVATLAGVEVARGCVSSSLPARAPIVTQLTSANCPGGDTEGGVGDGDGEGPGDGDGDGDGGNGNGDGDGGLSGGDGGGEVVLDCSKGCDDGNACTSDQCMDNKCVSFAFSATLECDLALCTIGDICDKGRCVPGEANDTVCTDDNECTKEVCVMGTGCTSMNIDGPCEDTTSCITGESCKYGRCWGQSTCTEGEICDREQNACHSCVSDSQCDDNDPCTFDDCSCDTPDCVAGVCSHQQAEEGATCNDGFACTSDDVCTLGVCVGVPEDEACSDNNDCTADTCAVGQGCLHSNSVEASTMCSDSKECTSGDHCANGECVGTESCEGDEFCSPTGTCVECVETADCDNSNPCVQQTCTDGLCVRSFKNGAACQDPYPCTTGDFCQDGTCKTGTGRNHAHPSCVDSDPCTEDRCNPPGTNGCTHQVKDGLACNDGIGCTDPDQCVAGKCVGADACAGDPVCDLTLKQCVTCKKATEATDCDDHLACTADTCVAGACQNSPITAGPGSCSDATACSTDRCVNGVCVSDVDPGYACTNGSEPQCTTKVCVPGSGGTGCVPSFTTSPCTDALTCTNASNCDGQGHCVATSHICGPSGYCDPNDSQCHCMTAGETSCSNVCVNTNTSPSNCGGCGSKCRAGEGCSGGFCLPTGADGLCTPQRFNGRDYLSCKSDSCSGGNCDWVEARAKCRSFPGWDLAIINNSTENSNLVTIVGGADAWIGANDRGDNGGGFFTSCPNRPDDGEGSWWWIGPGVDGDEGANSYFCQQSGSTCNLKAGFYTNWERSSSKEPNNSGCECGLGTCPNGEDCAAIKANGFWNDDVCTNNKRFLCEAYQYPPPPP